MRVGPTLDTGMQGCDRDVSDAFFPPPAPEVLVPPNPPDVDG